jgi:hypothetical protein
VHYRTQAKVKQNPHVKLTLTGEYLWHFMKTHGDHRLLNLHWEPK